MKKVSLRFIFLILVKIIVAQDVSFELEEGSQFEIAWLSTDEMTIAPESKNDKQGQLLPNMLLGEGQWIEEAVIMTTTENEHYRCLLPSSVIGENKEAKSDEASELTPEYLLQPLQHQCTKLLMGYWNYELCHGDYLRQYHEEKLQNGRIEVDEYMLGESDDDLTDTLHMQSKETQSQEGSKIPVWPLHGHEYPYYTVKMGGGTPCDIKENKPRSVTIRYICDKEAYKYGSLLRVDEVTTCKYEALVSTPQLCQNSHYRLKEHPIQPIKCFAQDNAPRRPKALLEQELLQKSLRDSSSRATTSDLSGSGIDDGSLQSGSSQSGKSLRRAGNSNAFELDRGFIHTFLNGEMCLRGGAGWWLHEVCYGQYVKQLHLEQTGERTEVTLGTWDEKEHRKWFLKNGVKKASKVQVVHLYKGGDKCDLTGTHRQCQVKYKCVKTAKSSQISLYLEEPTTCSYILTVEGAFVCTLLEHMDDYGVFDKTNFEVTTEALKERGDSRKELSGVTTELKKEAKDSNAEVSKDSESNYDKDAPLGNQQQKESHEGQKSTHKEETEKQKARKN